MKARLRPQYQEPASGVTIADIMEDTGLTRDEVIRDLKQLQKQRMVDISQDIDALSDADIIRYKL